jgi:hypothetical protein
MTAVAPAQPATQVRIAAWFSVCGAPGCTRQIRPGHAITKRPGQAWRHLDCNRVQALDTSAEELTYA